jgi:phosphoribosylaminoimidazole carboxylase (NCAIR synthetase)
MTEPLAIRLHHRHPRRRATGPDAVGRSLPAGLRTHIYEPGAAPAARCLRHWTQAPYDDLEALRAFAGACDVITYEFENIPTDALDVLSETTPLARDRQALEVSQDRLTEKRFLAELGLKTAPFAPIDGRRRPVPPRWPRSARPRS